MENLLQLFLNNSSRLDKTALHLYSKAMKKIKHRLKKKKKTLAIGADEVSAQLETMVGADLYRQDLLNSQHFYILRQAIFNWQPHFLNDPRSMQKCGLIQNLLLALLPLFQKKQLLTRICFDYKSHLQAVIRKSEFFAKPSSSVKPLTDISLDAIDNILAQQVTITPKIDESFQSVLEKYKAVDKMQKTLQSKRGTTQQLQNFQHEFVSQRAIIEKKRDNQAVTFVKAIVTAFSMGLAAVFGIWNIKGRQTAKKINTILAA